VNMWGNVMKPDETFTCINPDADSASYHTNVTLWSLLSAGWLPCMLWGIGTAIGELPPYATSYAARKAGLEDEDFNEAFGVVDSAATCNNNNNSADVVVDWMKNWMIQFLEKHGFWGVLLMSAWPNAMFDLCGLCCGHFLMPFWTFFSAVFLGKAVIKVIITTITIIIMVVIMVITAT
ncbi:vacuole membrane protein, putative, partial [Perkinsus marinus ATCC 50983]